MNIQVISDLHREFGSHEINYQKADLVIFAGDVDIKTKGIEWILSEMPDKRVIYVLGNHEYYKGAYPKELNKIRKIAKGTNVSVLENDSVDIEGIIFHGSTLWTDFCLFENNPILYGSLCQQKMNDYRHIRIEPEYSKLRSIDTYKLHKIAINWLEKSLNKHRGKKNIVVTHHAPSKRSIPIQFSKDPLSSAYASNLDEFIEKWQPIYWIHGHVHKPIEYNITDTKVLCNPHGYIDEPYNGYQKELIIKL